MAEPILYLPTSSLISLQLIRSKDMDPHPQTIGSAIADLEAEVEHLRRTRELPSYEFEWRIKELDRLKRYARQARTSTRPEKGAEV